MMAVSQVYRFLWSLGTTFVFLPHLNLALLSDYKICGDSECQSPMSRVQAIRDYHGKDCRFLSFRQGDTVFVYHKLTGKRDDLWAGSIDKQFGYFPKDAVQEEQVHTTVEKVVETQKSDFFCMDEFDSTYLDVDDDDIDQKIQIQEPETAHITQNTDDMNAESHLTPSDSPVSAQKAEEDQTKNVGGSAAGSHEEAPETPVTPNQQGGSHSSWLGSSVTGWLGLGKEEQPGSVAEGQMEDESKETPAETSLTSSVTGLLGFGGNAKPDNAKENVKISEGTADSLTSTMTGWLGFGGGSKKETGEERETDEEKEPKEKFRSRRMSLDLEGSQLHEEEKKEMGTLGWLGNGLSSTLGFGLTADESGHEKKEKVQANSWLNLEIGGILGFRKDNFGNDESEESGSKEAEKVITLKEPIGSQNVDNSQSKEEIIETSTESKEVEELSKDRNLPSTDGVYGHSDESNTDTSDSGMTGGFHEEVEPTVDHNNISPHTKFEEESQASAGTPSAFFQTGDKEDEDDDDNIEKSKINEERSAEMEGEDPMIPRRTENEHMDNNREAMKSAIDQDFVTSSGSILAPDHISVNMKSTPIMEDEKNQMANKKAERVEEQGAEITNQADNTKESTDTAVKTMTGDDNEGEVSNKGSDLPEIYTAQAEEPSDDAEDSSRESKLYLPSSVEKNDPVPAEDEGFTSYSAGTNDENSETLALFNNSTETETVHGELEQKEETLSSQELQPNTDRNTENISKEDRGRSAQSTNQTSVSPLMEYIDTQSDSDDGKLKESFKDGINEFQQVQTEKEASGTEEESLNKSDPKLAISSELESEKEKELKDGQEVTKVKENEGLGELKEVKEPKEEEKDMNEAEVESTQRELEELKEDKKQLKTKELPEEEKEVKVDELTEEEQLEDVEEKEKKGEEKLVHSSHYEAEILSGMNTQERESHDKDTQGVNSSGSPFTEIVTELESHQDVEEKREDEVKKQEAVEELKSEEMEGEEVKEMDQEKHEIGENFKCSNELCPQVPKENVRGGLEEGVSSAAEGAVQAETPEKVANNSSEEAESTHALSQSHKTEPEDSESSSKSPQQLNSDQQMHTEKAATVDGDGNSDRKMSENGSEAQSEGGWEPSAPHSDPAYSQAVTSEQTAPRVTDEVSSPPSDQSGGTAESKTRGALGLVKNSFGFFSQTPTTESDGSTEPAKSLSTSPGEVSLPQDSLTPEPDSTTRQVGDVHTDSPGDADQPQLHASSAEIHSLQTRTLSKHYKNLLAHMNADETTVLLELFGRHKLQFLDYILSSSDTMSEKPDDEDESILSDIERLLHYHRETVIAPSLRPTDAPQEDNEKTQTLSALQKLETLLGRVRQAFNRRLSNNRNHQAEASCVGLSCSNDSKNKDANTEEESRKTQDPSVSQDATIRIDDWMTMQKDNGQVGDSIEKEKQSGSGEEEASVPHVQPPSPEKLKGVMKQVTDFIYQMAEESTTHAHAVKELLIWVTVQEFLPEIKPNDNAIFTIAWDITYRINHVSTCDILPSYYECFPSYKPLKNLQPLQVSQSNSKSCFVENGVFL